MNQTSPSVTSYLDKNFWNRGEGQFGKYLLWGAGIVAAVAGTLFFGPLVIAATGIIATIFANLLNMTITGGILFAIVYALSDPKFRGLFGFGYRTLIRKFWAIIVDMSPKAILDDVVDDLRQRFTRLVNNVKNFSAKVRATQKRIEANDAAMRHALELAQMAKKQGKVSETNLQAREAQRYKQFNDKLNVYYKKMEVILRVLKKVQEGSEFSLRDTESRVKFELMEHAALTDASMAIDEAVKIIQGDAHKKQLFDMAMEKLADEKAAMLSEMDTFMETSETFFSSVDLERAIADENSMKLLEDWEKRVDSMILGPGVKQGILNAAGDPTDVLDIDPEAVHVEAEPKRQRVGGQRNYFAD